MAKSSVWNGSLTPETRQIMQDGTLTALHQESEKSVKMALSQLVAVIAKHEVKEKGQWPQLTQFIHQHLQHQVS